MPRNEIPRHRSGDRDWTRLDRNERVVLAALYRPAPGATGGRTTADLAHATDLSRGQLASTLRALMSDRRCAPLGGVAVRRVAPDVFAVTAAWAARHRVPARAAA